MRIIIDARTIQDHFPGIGRYTYNLALALADTAPQDDFVLLHCPAQVNTRFDLAAFKTKPNVRIVETNARNFSLREQWTIPALLRKLRADIYHSPYYIMPYAPGVPSIVTTHDLLPLRYPQYFTALERLIFNLTFRMSLHASNQVISVSNSCASDLRARLNTPDAKIVVIPEAPAALFTPPLTDTILDARARFKLPAQYILYFGSNKPHKNLVRLVEAFAQVTVHDLRFTLVIAGHWDVRYDQAKRRTEELHLAERVRWLGPISQNDLPAIYGGATLFVFPSEYEGFGLPVIEAMACGAPVVCSNAASLPEVADDAALLFEPLQVNAIANALERGLHDPNLRQELRERGLTQAKKFSWLSAAQATLQVYHSTARATGHSSLQ